MPVLGLAYALSPAVGGEVEDFNVSLFRSAISIVILFTLLFQGVLTQVGLDPDYAKRLFVLAGTDSAFPRRGFHRYDHAQIPLLGRQVFSSLYPPSPIPYISTHIYVHRFAGEGLDAVTGESLSAHDNYLVRSIVNLEHRLYRFFENASLVASNPHTSQPLASSMGWRRSTSAQTT